MPMLHITTFIAAPVDVVFNLSRHIDLHKRSMAKYKEEAVAGIRYGLIEINDTVTWKAHHLFTLGTRVVERYRARWVVC